MSDHRKPTHDEVLKLHSEHAIKVDDDVQAMARHLRKREDVDRDVISAIGVLADELGAVDRLPERLRPPKPPPRPSGSPPPVHENARKSAEAAHGTYITLAIVVLELAVELARHL